MRSAWLIVVMAVVTGVADAKKPLFQRYKGDNEALQVMVGLSDAIAGVVLAVGTRVFLDESEGKSLDLARNIKSRENDLRTLREEYSQDNEIGQLAEAQRLLALFIEAQNKGIPCKREIDHFSDEVMRLSAVRAGRMTNDQWLQRIALAEEALRKARIERLVRQGKGYFLMTASGFFLVQVGTRIWVWNYYDADPGLMPNVVIGYHYGVRPVFKLVGVLDKVEGLFNDDTPRAEAP